MFLAGSWAIVNGSCEGIESREISVISTSSNPQKLRSHRSSRRCATQVRAATLVATRPKPTSDAMTKAARVRGVSAAMKWRSLRLRSPISQVALCDGLRALRIVFVRSVVVCTSNYSQTKGACEKGGLPAHAHFLCEMSATHRPKTQSCVSAFLRWGMTIAGLRSWHHLIQTRGSTMASIVCGAFSSRKDREASFESAMSTVACCIARVRRHSTTTDYVTWGRAGQ